MDNFSEDNVSTYSLKLDIFEGPLDLLLTLIKEKDFCLLYTSPSPRDLSTSRMPSSA